MIVGIFSGCSSSHGEKPEPVSVTGTLSLANDQPVKNVTITFFPTSSDQSQGAGIVDKAGKFTSKLVPGKYTYSIEGTGIKGVPKKYLSNDAAHTIEIPSGGTTLTIKLTE